LSVFIRRAFVSKTALCAEPATTAGEDKNWEVEISKLQTEAEARLDAKIDELMKNIETVGKK